MEEREGGPGISTETDKVFLADDFRL